MNLHVASLGRVARHGDLYSAYSDSFCGGRTIFTQQPLPPLFQRTYAASVQCGIEVSNCRSERCDSLGLQLEQQLSVLSADVPLRGSSKYIAPSSYDYGETTVALIYHNCAYVEKIDIFSSSVKALVSLSKLEDSGATHAVSEVEWGFICVIALTFRKNCESEYKDTILMLRELLAESVHQKNQPKEALKSRQKLSLPPGVVLEFFCDIDSEVPAKPRTIDECIAFLQRIANTNCGNERVAKQVAFKLLPLCVVELATAGTASFQRTLRAFDVIYAKKILRFLNGLDAWDMVLGRFMTNVRKHSYLLNAATVKEMSDWVKNLKVKMENEKLQMGNYIKMYRSSAAGIEQLEKDLLQTRASLEDVRCFLKKYSFVKEKLAYIIKLKKLGVYVATDLEVFRRKLFKGEHFVFYANLSSMGIAFQEQSHVFQKLCYNFGRKCILFDTHVLSTRHQKENSIVHYEANICVEKDVYRFWNLARNQNVVRFDAVVPNSLEKPKLRVQVNVACPRSRCTHGCGKNKRKWICYYCQDLVEYGYYNQRFYCSCGESNPFSAKWFCCDPNHGMRYVQFERRDLVNELSSIEKWKEINILLIGETGSGKSTWINSIVNYVLHKSLTEALKCPLTCPIPSSFTIQSDLYQEKRICVGQSGNEVLEQGMSATQEPRSYAFMYKNCLIRLIDVPGICDTRGPEQDRKNLDLILRELQRTDKLHAVCVLLGPNVPRLNLAFKYCMGEILTHLHKNAAQNVVFCFTKTRQTFYKAGETLPILREYLADLDESRGVRIQLGRQTSYCFDNEAFKMLCAINNGVQFSEPEKLAFQESWVVSAKETYRFLDHVLTLTPHKTFETVSLGEARKIFVASTAPLAEITEKIDSYLRLIENEKKEINEQNSAASDLAEGLHVKRKTLVAKEIDSPRIVCAGEGCAESMRMPETGELVVRYSQICHNPCYLDNVEMGVISAPGVMECCAMQGETCRICGCRWDLHLLICYVQEFQDVIVVDQHVKTLLEDRKTAVFQKQDKVKSYEHEISKLEERRETLTSFFQQIGAFLNQNCIMPYNDSMVEYLQRAIALAMEETGGAKNLQNVDDLKSSLQKLTEELNILKANIDSGVQEVTFDDIKQVRDELSSMELGQCVVDDYIGTVRNTTDSQCEAKETFFDVHENTDSKDLALPRWHAPSTATVAVTRYVLFICVVHVFMFVLFCIYEVRIRFTA